MAKKLHIFLIPLFLSSLHYSPTTTAEPTDDSNPDPTSFIRVECRATLYSSLCIESLSNYSSTIRQSHHQLAQAALAVSLAKAQATASFVARLTNLEGFKRKEYQAVKDCTVTLKDTVDQLSRSMKELGSMGQVDGQDFDWHVSNVQTWVSAALTNENTCLDGFSGNEMNGIVKVVVRRRVVRCEEVTSNALALINRFAARHKR